MLTQQIQIASAWDPNARVVLAPGDCLTTLRAIPKGAINLIVTSPPYNIGKEYEQRVELSRYVNDMQEVLVELVRVLAEGGSLCWQVGSYVNNGHVYPLDVYFFPAFADLGLIPRNRIVWHFEHGLNASKRFSGRYETLLWFTKGETYTFNLDQVRVPAKYPGKTHFKGPKKGQPSCNPLGKNPGDFWRVLMEDWESGVWIVPNVKANHPEKTIHPCQFPIELVERCVLALSNADDWVLDPYAGVGTTVLAALKNGRRGAGCETMDDYISVAQQRVTSLLEGNLPCRPLGKPVYQPTGREKVAQIPAAWSTGPSITGSSSSEDSAPSRKDARQA